VNPPTRLARLGEVAVEHIPPTDCVPLRLLNAGLEQQAVQTARRRIGRLLARSFYRSNPIGGGVTITRSGTGER
jgi:hypothetical protein